MIQADLTQAMLAQGRIADAAEAIAELDARPIPCDTEWVILRHIAGARLAASTGEHNSGLADARSAIGIAERTDLIVIHADALCAQAGCSRRPGTRPRIDGGPAGPGPPGGQGEHRAGGGHASAVRPAARAWAGSERSLR